MERKAKEAAKYRLTNTSINDIISTNIRLQDEKSLLSNALRNAHDENEQIKKEILEMRTHVAALQEEKLRMEEDRNKVLEEREEARLQVAFTQFMQWTLWNKKGIWKVMKNEMIIKHLGNDDDKRSKIVEMSA